MEYNQAESLVFCIVITKRLTANKDNETCSTGSLE